MERNFSQHVKEILGYSREEAERLQNSNIVPEHYESKNYVTSGVDVLLGVCKDSANEDMAKEFVSFMMEQENAQTYIDEQFAFSALKDVEQSDEAVSGVQEDISNGKVANFEDHYYPSGFDMSALLTELSLNRANGMDDKENIEQFLKQCDEKYDIANVD